MIQGKERYLAERDEYQLRVPKVPRQSVDIFARDVQNGDYGLSSEKIETILSYVTLQQKLDSFEDLAFSSDFIAKLPSELHEKLGENLHPGIALSDLEMPTTDKVLLARMLAADRLTDTLSKTPVEVWITPKIQEELKEHGFTCNARLQQIDYSQLSLKAKSYLVEVMENQEYQVHTILAARNRFPNGVPPLGFSALLSGQRERTMFNSLKDLEAQYKAARQVLDNPLLLWFSELLEESRKKVESGKGQKKQDTTNQRQDSEDEFPINVEEEAKGEWWIPEEFTDFRRYEAVMKKVAEFLRPKYANKTIYEILGVDAEEAQQEVLSAFWRTGGSKHIDFGDEPWLRNELYLKTNGTFEVYYRDDLHMDEEKISTVTGTLGATWEVAMADQTVKWIQEEMSKMKTVREQWGKSGFGQSPTIEVTLATALSINRDSELQEEIDGLPKWFLAALDQEAQYYNRLINYTPRYDLDDPFLPLDSRDEPCQNILKSYFDLANSRLERDRRLITNPTELYKDLELDPSASQEEVKRAYRKIAKETRAIHISSPDEFDPEQWQAMNDRFVRATKAYMAISNKHLGETRVTTLGRITSYFQTVN